MKKTCLALSLLACFLTLYNSNLLSSVYAKTETRQIVTETNKQASQIYKRNCASCHDRGIMGAPKPGDSRFLEDIDVLVENAIKGIGNMPARGHAAFLSDDEVRMVVEYMSSPQ